MAVEGAGCGLPYPVDVRVGDEAVPTAAHQLRVPATGQELPRPTTKVKEKQNFMQKRELRIRIQLFTFVWIRIRLFILMRFRISDANLRPLFYRPSKAPFD